MNRLREKTTATILIAIFMISAVAVAIPVMSQEGTHLVADGDKGTEARIAISMPAGTTLGDIESIIWEYFLVAGYAPHVDIMLDTDADTEVDEALVVEYAYNDVPEHSDEGPPTYGCLTGAWYTTFSDDLDGPYAVTDTAMAWATTGAPGPLGGTFGEYNFWFQSLADWKTGAVINTGSGEKTINADTLVLALEIEIDNWIIDTEAYVMDLKINNEDAMFEGDGVSMMASPTYPIVSISVDTASITFDTVTIGGWPVEESVTVTHTGSVEIQEDISFELIDDVTGFYGRCLVVTPSSVVLDPGDGQAFDLDLTVPVTEAPGEYKGTLVFWAEYEGVYTPTP